MDCLRSEPPDNVVARLSDVAGPLRIARPESSERCWRCSYGGPRRACSGQRRTMRGGAVHGQAPQATEELLARSAVLMRRLDHVMAMRSS